MSQQITIVFFSPAGGRARLSFIASPEMMPVVRRMGRLPEI
jgi:hypothetical protein